MQELIDRLEKGTEPDRELDALIWAEMDGRDVRWDGNKLLARHRRKPHDECWLGTIDPGKVNRNFSLMVGYQPPIPCFTSSIDAALRLVPEGKEWNLHRVHDHHDGGKAYFCASIDESQVHYGANPAIALCIASLRARSR